MNARPRPSISVIVPFAGSPSQLSELLRRLERLERRQGDEVIVADNRPDGGIEGETGSISVIRAEGVCSPGFARNRAAATAAGEWLVMIDADTDPTPRLLDLYFEPPPQPRTAILAGGIRDRAAAGSGIAARRSTDRSQMSQRATLHRGPWSYAQSANIAVRRTAFVLAGGFDEEARAGEDADLCFRLARAGWRLEERAAADVAHESRGSVRGLLEQLAQHGAGAAWLERRYPGSFPAPSARSLSARLARHFAKAALMALRGSRDDALGELLGAAEACAFEGGRLRSNRPRRATYQ